MDEFTLHPVVRRWFEDRFGSPTEPQRRGWPHIAAGRHTLIAAPTGSGKTLAAFLICLDQLWKDAIAGKLADSVQVVYVSPLKALSNDIERNLQRPLAELTQLAASMDQPVPEIRAAVRTGDTPAAQRQSMLRRPPHILVTTPESLYILLTSAKSREVLRSTRTVIVDEIHALARDKRGSHLALTLERLAAICPRPPVRIGLSATQRPIDEISRFLVGTDGRAEEGAADRVEVVDAGHVRTLDLGLVTPRTELSAVCSHEQWGEVYEQLSELISRHRSTLIFVNTRRLAERVGHHLREALGADAVASHHGSLSREIRLSAEQRLKHGKLKAIVATSSLEMGIDIGYIDLVCQIGSPRSIAAFLQRVGRAGHSLGAIPRGRLFPLTRDELLECVALIRAVRHRRLDQIEIPVAPLDILAQQIVAAVACDDWPEDDLYQLCRRAWPFRHLARDEFEQMLAMLSEGLTRQNRRGIYLHRDRIHGIVRARRGARLAAITSGGAIPDAAEYRVVAEPDGTVVGKVDEDFAIESMAGDVFLLGNTSWRVRHVRAGDVVVSDAEGAPPSIPFWFGEGPGRTIELSEEVSRLRQDIAEWLGRGESAAAIHQRLAEEGGADQPTADQAVRYVEAQVAALGLVPTGTQIVFERFFDESGGMQLVIHAPLGQRINRAWGLALRKRFCRSFDFELQAAATDNGVLLSLSPQHSFAIESLFKMLGPHNGRHLLEQAVLAQPMFQVRWRWNVTRALAVLRQQNGRRVPPHMLRFRSDDLLAAAFPETVGCLENHHGDVEIPDHPLVRQTMHDCLHEAMDVRRWLELLAAVRDGAVQLIACDTREPSPFCHEILNANPYAFLDGAPLEERRTRAVSARRTFTAEEIRDLATLDPAAIAQVRDEAWPTVRDAEELHDVLQRLVVVFAAEGAGWGEWLAELAAVGRAVRVQDVGDASCWIAAERWPVIRALYPAATTGTPVQLPPALNGELDATAAIVELVLGRISVSGPVAAGDLARDFGLPESQVFAALEAIEAQGNVLRGSFRSGLGRRGTSTETEWCDRRLLARIHRATLAGLRERIRPVEPVDYLRFLARHQRVVPDHQWSQALGVREATGLLEGWEAPAGCWERWLLPARVAAYDPQWLDHVFLSGEVVWGRLQPPRREERDGQTAAALTRVVPISLVLREDLPWLTEPADDSHMPRLRGAAAQVLEALKQRGALFLQDLKQLTGLLPGHLDDALRELAASGLVTSDGFAAVRAFVAEKTSSRIRRGSAPGSGMSAPSGRWTLFPGFSTTVDPGERLERWCRQLLRRYGVVFRDLLARESCAPSWQELAPVLRRMELRGEVRGGRFVSGVGGEQFAEETAVERLREVRDAPLESDWLLLSAGDPLNLSGIVGDGPRIAAAHRNAMILYRGRCVGARQSGQIELFQTFEPVVQADMRRALQTGRRLAATAVPDEWPRAPQPGARPRSLLDTPSRSLRLN
ncbi:MAG: DEAD/DEAH box helicase [Pirellulaceae bacterium]